jgi:hypothetical protein
VLQILQRLGAIPLKHTPYFAIGRTAALLILGSGRSAGCLTEILLVKATKSSARSLQAVIAPALQQELLFGL